MHSNLGLDPYCRSTSPLRRLEDLVMAHHLKLRHTGQLPTEEDEKIMTLAIRNLNRRLVYDAVARSRQKIRQTAGPTTSSQTSVGGETESAA